MKEENPVSYFAEVTNRTDGRRFGVRRLDRRFHFYTIGRTGTGKSENNGHRQNLKKLGEACPTTGKAPGMSMIRCWS